MTEQERWSFVMEHIKEIDKYAYMLCKGSGLCHEEFLQDVRVKVHEKAHKYDPSRGRVSNFIYFQARCVRTLKLDKRETSKVKRKSISEIAIGEDIVPIAEQLESLTSGPEARAEARSELETLTQEQLYVLIMVHDKVAYKDIANSMGKTLRYVTKVVNTMREEWRERYPEEEGWLMQIVEND